MCANPEIIPPTSPSLPHMSGDTVERDGTQQNHPRHYRRPHRVDPNPLHRENEIENIATLRPAQAAAHAAAPRATLPVLAPRRVGHGPTSIYRNLIQLRRAWRSASRDFRVFQAWRGDVAKIATWRSPRAATSAAAPLATLPALAPGRVLHGPTSVRVILYTHIEHGSTQNAIFSRVGIQQGRRWVRSKKL